MQQNTFHVGDRVTLIPFRHKGKLATVKYFGQIGRKFGTWVGLELDEPTGEMNGDVNGEQLFECKPNHGLVLRNTQVKLTDGESIPARPRTQVPQLIPDLGEEAKIGGGTTLGDSPLVTPRCNDDQDEDAPRQASASGSQPPQSTLMEQMSRAIQNPTAVRARTDAVEDTKKRGWQERLEMLKQKKAATKAAQKQQEEDKTAAPKNDEDKLRDSFAPASGIKRTNDGNLQVDKAAVVKGPSGEQILEKAVEETAKAPEEASTPARTVTTRSSLASLSKLMTKTSPDKATREEAKVAKATPASRISIAATGTPGRTTLGAKREEMARQRTTRATGIGSASKPGTASGANSARQPGMIGGAAASGSSTARNTVRISARPGAAGTAGSTTSRTTLSSRVGAKKDEEEKKTTGVRRPAMTTSTVGGLRRPSVRADSAMRGASSGRQTIGKSEQSPKRTTTARESATATRPALSQRTTGGVRDRTPGPSSGTVTSKVTPMEIRKMENAIKDKDSEIAKLAAQITGLQTDKTALTKEKATVEAQATKAQKEKAETLAKAQKERDEAEAKGARERETIKKQYEAKISNLQKQIESQSEENQALQASQDEQASLERSKIDEETSERVVALESQLEEMTIKMQDQEQQLAESSRVAIEFETKVTEQEITQVESAQQLKDQAARIAEMEAALAEKESAHEARIADLDNQLKISKEELAEGALKWKAQNKEAYQRMEKDVAAKFEETKKTFEKSLLEAQDAAKKALDAEKVAATKFEEEQQRRVDEQEIFELEKATLNDEKQELMEKIMEQGKVEEEDPLKDLSLEEIKLQNEKLRKAITALTFGFEEEKRKLENQMKNETGKDATIAGLEKQLEEMNFLLEEVERKEQERAEMEEKLEEIVEYENMVEEMVQEIANREEENEELVERIAQLEEEMELMDELNQGLELDNTEMQEELTEKEKELSAAKNEIDQLEGIVIDQDSITTKYKERQQELHNQIKVMSEQIAETANSDNKDQISVLLEKQQTLIARLRDAEKKSLQITKSQITMQQDRFSIDVVQNMLPESLMTEAMLPNLKKIQSLNFVKHKAMMLLRELCETQIDNAVNVYSDLEQLNQFFHAMLSLSMLSNRLVQSGHRIVYFIANMSPGQYAEITAILAWDSLDRVAEEIDSILELLKDENLTYNFDCGNFERFVKQVEQLQNTVETAFQALSPEELKERMELGPAAPEPETQTRRKALVQSTPKLALREQVSVVAIAVMFVPRLSTLYASELERRQVIQKVALIYWRLLDIVLKLDNITNTESGQEYLDDDTANVDQRLSQKFDTIKVLWTGSGEEKHEASKKSWSSVLEAIERDVIALNNNFKFKQLAERVEAKYGANKIDFNDLYGVDFKAGGPWRVVTEQVKSELRDMGALKNKNSHLMEKQKEQLKQMAMMKKEKDEAVFITQTLKGQLQQAQAKADQVPALEIERNDLSEKVNTVQNQLQQAEGQIKKSKKEVTEMKTKVEEAKKQQAEAAQNAEQEMMMGQARSGVRRGNVIRARPGNKHMSRESMAAMQFRNLQSAGLGATSESTRNSQNHLRGQSTANSAQVMQQMQAAEDMYMETIGQLQADRMRLRGKDMLQRLNSLQNKESAFSTLTKQMRDDEARQKAEAYGTIIKLNKAEQLKVQSALESVETLKFKVKRQMATRRIVDLTSKPKPEEAKDGDEAAAAAATSGKPVETLNFMVMDTRGKINDALKVLFSRDSKLRRLQDAAQSVADGASSAVSTATKPVDPGENAPAKPADTGNAAVKADQVNQVKVGTLRLRSKIRIPQSRVVLDDKTMTELKRNVALFAS